jgi:hypothetical protein
MKSNHPLRTLTSILFLALSLFAASAQQPPGAGPAIDPTTGLPVAQPAPPRWDNASDWKDPGKVVPSIQWDGIPVPEAARILRTQFSNEFDIVIPGSYQPVGFVSTVPVDVETYSVKLQLRNVTAGEIFGAMNLEFEAENTPLQWVPRMNGDRPTAVLRFVPALLPPPAQIERKVFSASSIIGDEHSGGMAMSEVIHTIDQAWHQTYTSQGDANVVQYYEPAQLIIVSGTSDQISFVAGILDALDAKVETARHRMIEAAREKEQSGGSAPAPQNK